MFKKLVRRIAEAKSREEAIQNVFYGPDGIDMAFQREKISWDDHELLLSLIVRLS